LIDDNARHLAEEDASLPFWEWELLPQCPRATKTGCVCNLIQAETVVREQRRRANAATCRANEDFVPPRWRGASCRSGGGVFDA